VVVAVDGLGVRFRRERLLASGVGCGGPWRSQSKATATLVIDAPVRDGVEVLNTAGGWYPAIDSSGAIREGACVVGRTKLVDLSKWPTAPGWPSTLLGERGITSQGRGNVACLRRGRCDARMSLRTPLCLGRSRRRRR
jgi:hypothetical protein